MELEFFLPVHLFQPNHVRDVKKRSRKHSSKHWKATGKLAAALLGIFWSLKAYKFNTAMFQRQGITGYVTHHRQKKVANSCVWM